MEKSNQQTVLNSYEENQYGCITDQELAGALHRLAMLCLLTRWWHFSV